jgi:aspartate aminotransferase
MTLAYRTTLIKESPTMAISSKANKMKKSGQDVMILAAGEPDFDTPTHIKEAAIAAIHTGKTKYTPVGGTPELKQAIIDKFARENQLNYALDEVTTSCGAKHSIYNALQVIINEGDEVIIPAPYWVSYPDMVLLSGGTPVIIACGVDDQYKLTAAKMEKAITAKTKAIMLNSPSNPTGMVYSEQELNSLANVLKQHPNVYIISDDIYEHILFNGNTFSNIVNVAPELKHRAIVVNGVSKAYSMTGWRIGYTACNDAMLIKAMENIQSQSTSNPCSISQAAAVAALNGGHECLKEMHKEFAIRQEYVVNRINNIKGLRCLSPQGAFYAFFECSQAIEILHNQGKISEKTDLAFANYLLDTALVAGVPGSAFGLNNHMRFSFATSMTQLAEALNRLETALR